MAGIMVVDEFTELQKRFEKLEGEVAVLTKARDDVLSKSDRSESALSTALASLADQAFVLSPENYELRETTLVACRQAGFTPRVVLDGGEMDTLLRFVAAGLGVALVPRLALDGQNDLVAVRISDQKLRRSLAIVWRKDRVASPAARALREFLIETLRPNGQTKDEGRKTKDGATHLP